MKWVFALCADDNCFLKIYLDFKCAQRIIEDSERYGWNKDLPVGNRLIKDVETRFDSFFSLQRGFSNPLIKYGTFSLPKDGK